MARIFFYPFLVVGIALVTFLPFLPDWRITLIPFAMLLLWRKISTPHRQIIILLCAFFAGIAWSAWRSELHLARRLPERLENTPLTLIGSVSDIPNMDKLGAHVRFKVESIEGESQNAVHTILLADYRQQTWPAGSRWKLNVNLKRPLARLNPAGFDREAWYWAEQIDAVGSIRKGRTELAPSTTFLARVNRWRERLLKRIEENGAEHPRAAGIIAALTIGVKNRISQADWRLFRATGLIHLVSISGLHITLLAALVSFLVARMLRYFPFRSSAPRLIIAFSGLSAAAGYALLAGWSVPTQRTLYMLLVTALMLLWRRSLSAFKIWWIALSVVLLIDPFAVLSPGLWLSFGLVAILMMSTLGRRKMPKKLLAAWQSQWAISVASIVLLSIFFAAIPLISPLLNAIAIPLVSMLITPLALLGLICPWSGILKLSIWITAHGLNLLDASAKFAAIYSLPLTPKPLWILAICGALWLIAPRGTPARLTGILLIAPMLLYRPPTPKFGTVFIQVTDVGQGLSLFVRTNKHALLFDTGYGDAQSLLLPQLHAMGINNLDTVIASHNDSDHDGALPSLLNGMPVKQIFAGQADKEQKRTKRNDIIACQRGQTWAWDGVRFDILAPVAGYHPKPKNNNAASCVLRIATQKLALIVTGDLPISGEKQLIQFYGKALHSEVLLPGHHGSKTSTSEEWLSAVKPKFALISDGYLNRYHHPHPKVLNLLAEHKINIWRTDLQGALQTTLDDTQPIKIQAQRDGILEFWRIRPGSLSGLTISRENKTP